MAQAECRAAQEPVLEGDRLLVFDQRVARGLSTPARLVALDELYRSQRDLTATHLAALAAVSASAMSYHLRELAAAGLIMPGGAPLDSRQRLWRAAAASYSLIASEDSDSRTRTLLVDMHLQAMRQRMLTVLARRSRRPFDQRSERYMVMATGDLLLTRDELAAAQAEVLAVWERYEDLASGRTRADGLEYARYMWSCLPDTPGEDD